MEGQNEEEENLRKAIEESKQSANSLATAEERDVQRAIELSREEEDRRKRLMALAERGVFDDTDFVCVCSVSYAPVSGRSLCFALPIYSL